MRHTAHPKKTTREDDGTVSLTAYYYVGSLYIQIGKENFMAKALRSLRLDDRLVRKAQRVLGAKSRTQTIEMSLEAVVETEKHRKLIKRYSGQARPGDFDRS
jgi:hypothetical protein